MINNNMQFITIFEKQLAKFVGAKECVVVDSCSNAIFLSLFGLNSFGKNSTIELPKCTYISVPFACIRAGYDIKLVDKKWNYYYKIGKLPIYDCAVMFYKNMFKHRFKQNDLVCTSFQQKKILPIGKGGAIFLNSSKLANKLRRLAYDGRNYMSNMMDDDIANFGFHMNMTPEQASKGILLFNQLKPTFTNKKNNIPSYKSYRDLTSFSVFEDII